LCLSNEVLELLDSPFTSSEDHSEDTEDDHLQFTEIELDTEEDVTPRKIENGKNLDRFFSVLVFCLLKFFFSDS